MADITRLMQRGLDGSWLRHEVLAGNVANSETPGYKKKDLNFAHYLKNAIGPRTVLSTTSPLHLEKASHDIPLVTQDTSSVTPDGNSVDIDREMAEVSANALYYTSLSRQLAAHFSLLRKAITEGRR
ncbi:MAG: flagellar basal body rod protein FlgB [Bacillota bacterium]|jgi:flagellar basal-body rod protein FlgB